MSNDIERLLAAAADDADQPLHTDVEDILVRARRSVRRTRIATVTTATITTAAILGGVAAWSSNRTESVGPAGTDQGQTVTIDPKTGAVLSDEAGKAVVPPPPVSPLSDESLRSQCKQYDTENLTFNREHNANTYDKAGPLDANWKVMVKAGTGKVAEVLFLSPDKSIVAQCSLIDTGKAERYGRTSMKPTGESREPAAENNGLWVPAAGVTRVVADWEGETTPRQALMGADGFFTLGPGHPASDPRLVRVRGYDADGKRIYERTRPTIPTAQPPSVDPKVTVKTVEPITPEVVLTEDPLTGKALAPAPPVSPLTDDQVRDRCRLWEHEIETNPAYGRKGKPERDKRLSEAGPITSSWAVALKTGTGDKLTAVLVSPDQRVAVWCHMTKATFKGGESDYTRIAVQADGRFADNFEWAMVPEGVAQLVVDLPTTGPTRALISNGYYIWGLTGGNSDIQNVRVRGYDAQGKQVYDQKKQVDAD